MAAAALVFPHRPAAWPILLAVHVGLVYLLFTGLRPLRRAADASEPGPTAGVAKFLIHWYPLLLIPFLYWELPILNSAVWGGRIFDATVQGWEHAVFGGQPALQLWRDWDSVVLSELLHLAYLSYYPILYLFPVVVYHKRGDEALHGTLFAMMLGFAVHYTVFIFFPVEGPYFVYPAPGEPASTGIFYAAVHFVLGSGASAGTAFPSSHMALSTVQTGNALRFLRPATPILAVCVVGIGVGAVYASIHYAIDMVVGLAAGIALTMAAPAVQRRLQ